MKSLWVHSEGMPKGLNVASHEEIEGLDLFGVQFSLIEGRKSPRHCRTAHGQPANCRNLAEVGIACW